MKKAAVFLILSVFLFLTNCNFHKKFNLEITEKLNAQEKKIEKLQQQLQILEQNYQLKTEQQAKEIEKLKQFINLLQKYNRENAQTLINPFIPEKVTFCGQPVPLDKFKVRERLKRALQSEMTRWPMALIFLRSGRWFPMIEEKIRKLGLPYDLKYIPAIESDLNPETPPSYAGAAGMWQIIKSTARNIMGLRVDYYLDQRYDPQASTQAALVHLQELYAEFNNWLSALAGYNMHKDRYREQMQAEGVDNFYEVIGIPIQTQRYVFRAIAVKLIMENPEKYGFPPLEKINEIKFQPYPVISKVITVKSQESIPSIARRLGMSCYEFRTFNPHIAPVNSRGNIIRDYLLRGKYKVYIKKES